VESVNQHQEIAMNPRYTFVAAVVAALAVSVAQAGTPVRVNSDQQSETVRFADLDTSSPQGAAALYQRISSAAVRVCRNLEPFRMLALKQPYANCLHTAIANAVEQVNRPAVSAYALARGVESSSTIQIARN
jgi:UrcA family protein